MRILIIISLSILILVLFFNLSNKDNSNKNFKKETIKTLVRQAGRWSTAAAQDENIMIAVLHANYGAGYLYALRDIATDREIENVTGIDVLKFRDEITKIQDIVTKRMGKACPKYAPTKSYLAKIAGEL